MGYTTRTHRHGETKHFWPDDNEHEFWLKSDMQPSLAMILNMAKEKWPGIDPNDILIEAEKIHTDCIGYDLYDPGDYTNFIRISQSQK